MRGITVAGVGNSGSAEGSRTPRGACAGSTVDGRDGGGRVSSSIKEIGATRNVEVKVGSEVVDGEGHGRLEALVILDLATGERVWEPAAALVVLIGTEPRTDWLPPAVERDRWGYVLTGPDVLRDGKPPPAWSIERQPMLLETSVPGVFAAGDVRARSVKRVASAVGEGAIAIQLVHDYLNHA
jgi:thioredoxin reductase (NADPH)